MTSLSAMSKSTSSQSKLPISSYENLVEIQMMLHILTTKCRNPAYAPWHQASQTGFVRQPCQLEISDSDFRRLDSDRACMNNQKSSPIYILPPEILLEIADHLSPRDRLILQRVSSKFRNVLVPSGIAPEIEKNLMTAGETDQFKCLVRQENERKLQEDYEIASEMAPSDSELYLFGCSACRTTHDMTCFTDEELQKSPKVRVCRGAAGTYEVCCHMAFSGQCLLRALRIFKDADIYCHQRHFDEAYEQCLPGPGSYKSGPRLGFHGGHTITIDSWLPVMLNEAESLTSERLVSALCDLDADICPHLKSSDPRTFEEGALQEVCQRYPFEEVDERPLKGFYACRDFLDFPDSDLLRKGNRISWSQCHHPDCRTRYCLRQVSDSLSECSAVVLEVSRDLLHSPNHPNWLAQRKQATRIPPMDPVHAEDAESKKSSCSSRHNQCASTCVLTNVTKFLGYDFQERQSYSRDRDAQITKALLNLLRGTGGRLF